MRHWWTGMMIVALGELPFAGLLNVLRYFHPRLANGQAPHWWGVLSLLILVISFLVSPFIIRIRARKILRPDGWFERRSGRSGAKGALP